MLLLRTDAQQSAGVLRFRIGAKSKTRAKAAVSCREANLNNLVLATILRWCPADTLMSLRANSSLMVLINLELAVINPLRCVGLPLRIDFAGSNEFHSKHLLTRSKQMGSDIP